MAFILLTFIGQAVAYNYVSCNMNTSATQVTSNVENPTSHSHEALMTSSDMEDVHSEIHDHDDNPICEKDCCCPMSSCFGLALVNEPVTLHDLAINTQKISQFRSFNLTRFPTSLYRPPIFS